MRSFAKQLSIFALTLKVLTSEDSSLNTGARDKIEKSSTDEDVQSETREDGDFEILSHPIEKTLADDRRENGDESTQSDDGEVDNEEDRIFSTSSGLKTFKEIMETEFVDEDGRHEGFMEIKSLTKKEMIADAMRENGDESTKSDDKNPQEGTDAEEDFEIVDP